MSNAQEWFRQETWSPEIEAAFFAKLRRARDKAQYLRIQASCLAASAPHAALRLLDDYFALGEHFDLAQAHVDRARAQLALEDLDAAIVSLEAALDRERVFPNLKTLAYLELPMLVAERRLSGLYTRALEVLAEGRLRPMFPIDRFRWHAARGLILHDLHCGPEAAAEARRALSAAAETTSGFQYHPALGLVGGGEADVVLRLRSMAGA